MSWETDFCCGLIPPLTELRIGNGRIDHMPGRLHLQIDPDAAGGYSDAQIMDYTGLQRRDYPNQPPVTLHLTARFSHEADQWRGTAGFGFWNQPLMPGQGGVRLPRAAWFFLAGQPCNMALAKGVAGYGWKAATLDASRPGFLALAPTAPIGIFLMRVPALYRTLYPIAQQALGVAEAIISSPITEWHTYTLNWLGSEVRFTVDDQLVLTAPFSPRAPLGFILWVDNQFAIVTPQGRLGGGVIGLEASQWLEVNACAVISGVR